VQDFHVRVRSVNKVPREEEKLWNKILYKSEECRYYVNVKCFLKLRSGWTIHDLSYFDCKGLCEMFQHVNE
jgi:hypothetical protein